MSPSDDAFAVREADAAEVRAINARIEGKALLRDAFRDPDSPDVPRDEATPAARA